MNVVALESGLMIILKFNNDRLKFLYSSFHRLAFDVETKNVTKIQSIMPTRS